MDYYAHFWNACLDWWVINSAMHNNAQANFLQFFGLLDCDRKMRSLQCFGRSMTLGKLPIRLS